MSRHAVFACGDLFEASYHSHCDGRMGDGMTCAYTRTQDRRGSRDSIEMDIAPAERKHRVQTEGASIFGL